MGKIITVASQKGGVGKTTTALNLGYSLSRFGDRVLVVDADPQGGIGISTNLKKVTSLGLLNLIKGDCSAKDSVMITRDKTMAIVGVGIESPEDVLTFEEEVRKGAVSETIAALASNADYLIIDAPAGVGGIVNSLFAVSNSVLLVVNCRILTLKSIPNFLKMLTFAQQKNPSLRLEGVIFTMLNSGNVDETKMLKSFQTTLPEEIFFKTSIPLDNLFEKASLKAIPVGMLRGGQQAARFYIDLAMELKERELHYGTGGVTDEEEGLF